MSVQMVLLPVFVQVGLTLFLLLWMATGRTRALSSREVRTKDIALGQPNWPEDLAKVGNCFRNQFEVPVLFYVVVTRFVHAGIFVTSNNVRQRGAAWFAGVLVLLAMWIYFALKILLLI